MATLGMKEPEMVEIADAIVELLQNTKPAVDEKAPGFSRAKVDIDPKALSSEQKKIATLLSTYPLYPELVIDYTERGSKIGLGLRESSRGST